MTRDDAPSDDDPLSNGSAPSDERSSTSTSESDDVLPDFEDKPMVETPTADPPSRRELETKDVLAVALSILLPGIGHFIKGFTKRGLLILGLSFMTCCSFGLLNVGSALDVYCIAMTKTYRAVGDWEFFPDLDEHLKA